jgi:hypothetical protein
MDFPVNRLAAICKSVRLVDGAPCSGILNPQYCGANEVQLQMEVIPQMCGVVDFQSKS